MKFGKIESTELKGVALLMLLLHHSFGKASYFENFNVSFAPFNDLLIVNVALLCKLCVSVFVFISGYGLFLDCAKTSLSPQKWILNRYIKTFSGYQFVYVLSVIVCFALNRLPVTRYFGEGVITGITYMIVDFLGIASLFSTPMLNGTWWYMSAAFVFILITPIITKQKDNLIWFLLLSITFIRVIFAGNSDDPYTGQNSAYAFLSPFILGCIFAHYNIFEKVLSMKYKPLRFLIELTALRILYEAYHTLNAGKFWEIRFGLIPTIGILFIVEFILMVPILKDILYYIGKHSMNIFLIHTFISGTYLHKFLYSMNHWLLIIFTLLALSLIISIFIEQIKKVTNYNLLISYLCKLIQN